MYDSGATQYLEVFFTVPWMFEAAYLHPFAFHDKEMGRYAFGRIPYTRHSRYSATDGFSPVPFT